MADWWRTTSREWLLPFEIYRAQDAGAGPMRASLLALVMKLTPGLMLANVANGLLVVWAFHGIAPWALGIWLALLLLLVTQATRSWLRWRRHPPVAASIRAFKRASLHATLMGTIWAAVPLMLFHRIDPSQQTVVALVSVGMTMGGAFALSPLPQSALLYVGVLATASVASLWQSSGDLGFVLSGLLLCYTGVLCLGVLVNARHAHLLLRAQTEAARQGQIVTLLLNDFQENTSEALWETSHEGVLTHLSPRLADMLEASPEGLRERTLIGLLEGRSPAAAGKLSAALDLGRPFRGLQVQIPGATGPQWWSLSAKPSLDDAGRPEGWRGVIADITAEMLAQERYRHLAHHDSLTGLPNRLSLHERLALKISKGESAALLSLDLDHFKDINDTFGHSVGDAVLRQVALHLSACVRPQDMAARLGGDEFAILMSGVQSPQDALQLGQRLVRLLQQPQDVAGRQLVLGGSVGIALLPLHGRHVDELVGHADLALYDAKANGRGRVSLFEPRMSENSRRRADIEEGLRHAIARDELALHWQPKLDLRSWRIDGVEALLRWTHPVLGSVSPAEFVAVAESSGQIRELGRWVLEQACQVSATRWPQISVSVNVSPVQLAGEDFEALVVQALQTSALPAARLELEITESIFIDESRQAIAQLQSLRQRGVRIGLDDFGTGYSSLAYLRRFPFDTLKIDRAFVNELMLREDSRAIIRTMTQLASGMGMRTVAEGVETQDQLELLEQAGCDEVQGYLISRPVSAEHFTALLDSWPQHRPLRVDG